MSLLLTVLGAFGALLAIISLSLRSAPFFERDPGVCQSTSLTNNFLEGECFFSNNFIEATVKFIRAAKEVNAEVLDLQVTQELSTQAAILKGNPNNFFVHISGTHGIEAYAGSSIQLAALSYLKGIERSIAMPTIVFVHALNPYGFHHNRRTDENNVDINRNFLTDAEWTMVKNRDPNYANYVDFDTFLNPKAKPTGIVYIDEVLTLLKLLSVFTRHRFGSIKKAMVSGNYHQQKGYGFGGFARSKSADNLVTLLTETLSIPTQAQKIVFIDVHTGLGPQGVDTLMYNSQLDVEKIFPMELDSQGNAVGALKASSFAGPSTTQARKLLFIYSLELLVMNFYI
jgi:hypothetical protein